MNQDRKSMRNFAENVLQLDNLIISPISKKQKVKNLKISLKIEEYLKFLGFKNVSGCGLPHPDTNIVVCFGEKDNERAIIFTGLPKVADSFQYKPFPSFPCGHGSRRRTEGVNKE